MKGAAMEVKSIADGREALLSDLIELKAKLDHLKSVYLKTELIYKEKKRRFERLDRAWAERDGRLRIIKTEPKPKVKKEMTQDEIMSLIGELEAMIK